MYIYIYIYTYIHIYIYIFTFIFIFIFLFLFTLFQLVSNSNLVTVGLLDFKSKAHSFFLPPPSQSSPSSEYTPLLPPKALSLAQAFPDPSFLSPTSINPCCYVPRDLSPQDRLVQPPSSIPPCCDIPRKLYRQHVLFQTSTSQQSPLGGNSSK